MNKTVTRTLEVIFDEEDQLILKILSYADTLTVSQIRNSILMIAHKEIPSMILVRRLDKLCLLGDVIRVKKNSKVYKYVLAKQ